MMYGVYENREGGQRELESAWPTPESAEARCLSLRQARDEREYVNGWDLIRVGYYVASMPSTASATASLLDDG